MPSLNQLWEHSLSLSLSLTDTLISLSHSQTHLSLSLILYLIIYPSLSLSYFNRYHCNILVLITLHCLTTMLFVSPFLSMAATRVIHSIDQFIQAFRIFVKNCIKVKLWNLLLCYSLYYTLFASHAFYFNQVFCILQKLSIKYKLWHLIFH